VELGSRTTRDVPARLALGEVLIHQVSSNDEVERREVAPTSNEADLSRSSTSLLGPPKILRLAIARTDC
jgi:hypothetical protein